MFAAEDRIRCFRVGQRMAGTANFRPGRERILEPYPLGQLDRRRWVFLARILVNDICRDHVHLCFDLGDTFRERLELSVVALRFHLENGISQQAVTVQGRVRIRVKESIKRIEILGRDRVELVVVTDRTTGAQPKPGLGGGGGALDGITKDKFFSDGSSLAGGDIAAVEAGCDQLVVTGLWQQVAGDLLDREAVEGQVSVKRTHHPVAVGIHLSLVVEVHPVRVRIASHIEPVPCHLLTVMVRGQVTIDHPLVGARFRVTKEIIEFLERRRQSGRGESDPTNEGVEVGLRICCQPQFAQLGVDEVVNLSPVRWQRFGHRWLESPMLLIRRAFRYPPT